MLDSRAPEDQGFQPTVDITNRELRLPLNVNDNQIYPEMTCFPVELDGWTEMSFFLIQTESCRVLHPILDIQEQQSGDALLNITQKRKKIQERGQYLSAKYGILSGSGIAPDLSRIADQHTITACKKMEFVLQLREEISTRKQKGAKDGANPDVLKPSFKLACETLESNYVLLKDGFASSFRWFFNMYTQWYALAYVLRCLCSSTFGLETERAWTLVEELFPRDMSLNNHKAGAHDECESTSIWRCLNLLRSQAVSLRQHAQLHAASVNAEIQSSSSDIHGTSQLVPSTEIASHPCTTATAQEISTLSESHQKFIANPNQGVLPSLDLSMLDIPFLPDLDWNAVINGWMSDDHSCALR